MFYNRGWEMLRLIRGATVVVAMVAGSAAQAEDAFQYSTIAALMAASYDGQMPVGDLAKQGDFGLGTFDHVDGEMVVLDGTVWQVPADGRPRRAEADRHTPFAVVSRFKADRTVTVPAGLTYPQLEKYLDGAIGDAGTVVAVRVDGALASLKSRSIPAQKPPYRPLAEVIKTDQVTFTHGAVAGTLVGFRFPASATGANVPGWHFHFVDTDRRLGGHVLELVTGDGAVAGIQALDGVRLTFIEGGTGAKDAALEMVEKGR